MEPKINHSILATLAYFDIFDYPLTCDEILLFLDKEYCQKALMPALGELLRSHKIYRFHDFYMLNERPQIIQRRKYGNARATEMLKTARMVSGILIHFPFVRAIAVSGSLSKNYADEESDIDFFIITSANRLWIARTLMHLFKKLTFLVNKQNFFCMNYYIDEEGLEIIEKNIYTATEILTLIPMEGEDKFADFYSSNAWTSRYLPNISKQIPPHQISKSSWIKQFLESLFSHKLGDMLDNKFREITNKRWEKKTLQNKLNMRGIVMSMKANKHYSKPDPVNFQSKVLRAYEERVFQLTNEAVPVM